MSACDLSVHPHPLVPLLAALGCGGGGIGGEGRRGGKGRRPPGGVSVPVKEGVGALAGPWLDRDTKRPGGSGRLGGEGVGWGGAGEGGGAFQERGTRQAPFREGRSFVRERQETQRERDRGKGRRSRLREGGDFSSSLRRALMKVGRWVGGWVGGRSGWGGWVGGRGGMP